MPLHVIGMSYEKAEIDARCKFIVTPAQADALLVDAQRMEIDGVLLLSTCNRTELYACTSQVQDLIDLLLAHTQGDVTSWRRVGWIKQQEDAVAHFLRVGCGLESNILGDFQIIGQIKKAFEQSKTQGLANTFLDRLVNAAIRTSKRVKNETSLCNGSASVAYAAVDFIRQWGTSHSFQNILLLGAGDIGKATCSNLLKQFPHTELLVTNRSADKAEALEEKFGVHVIPWGNRLEALAKADIVVVATGVPFAILTSDMLTGDKAQLFLDLSVPRNISPEIGDLDRRTLLDMDELINHANLAISQRKAEVPKAEAIVGEMQEEFLNWLEKRRFSAIIQSLKSELASLQQAEIQNYTQKNPEVDTAHLEKINERVLNKITGRVAKFFNTHHDKLGAEVELFAEVLSS